MTITLQDKIKYFDHCRAILEKRLADLQKELKLTQESANSDTKSSMGDKYETSHAMAHLEKEKLSASISENNQLIKVLSEIKHHQECHEAKLGSIVQTSAGLFLIGVSLGALKIDNTSLFAISPVAPLGKVLIGKKAKESYELNGKSFEVLSVI